MRGVTFDGRGPVRGDYCFLKYFDKLMKFRDKLTGHELQENHVCHVLVLAETFLMVMITTNQSNLESICYINLGWVLDNVIQHGQKFIFKYLILHVLCVLK